MGNPLRSVRVTLLNGTILSDHFTANTHGTRNEDSTIAVVAATCHEWYLTGWRHIENKFVPWNAVAYIEYDRDSKS